MAAIVLETFYRELVKEGVEQLSVQWVAGDHM